MAYVYTLANAKGGCGKSTVAFNLAVSFARKGYRTLAIDLDQQGNLSGALGVDLNKLKLTTHRLLIDEQADIGLFLIEPRPRLKLLPNTIDIVADDLLEAKKVNRDLLLRSKLQPVLRNFDIVIIDTPPAMRAATLNGLAVADTTIVPVDSSFFALLGLNQLLQIIAAIRDAHQPNMVLRALTIHFNRRQNLDKQIRRQVEVFFGPDLVLRTPIHKSVGIVEATMFQKAAIEYSPATSGAFDFNKLTQELIEDHSEALSARIREAINPPRRQTPTARILDEVEPLSLLKTFSSEAEVGGVAQALEAPVTPTPPVSHALEGVSVEPSSPSVGATPAVTLTPARGVTAVPNAILDGLLPQIEPFEQLVYLRLYRLSHGFRNETCLMGLDRLSAVCKISPSSAIRAIRGLESKGLVRRLRAKLGGKMSEIRGNQFWVFRPPVPQTAAVSQTPGVSQTTHCRETPIKESDDDDKNGNHHQTSPAGVTARILRTTGEKTEQPHSNRLHHLAQTIGFYTQITKNLWQEGDTTAYLDNAVAEIPLDSLKSVMLAVSQRAGSRINSFAYFVKELTSTNNPGTRMARKKALAVIVKRVRENHVGARNYGTADFVFDVKEACAREGVVFDNDLFNAVCC